MNRLLLCTCVVLCGFTGAKAQDSIPVGQTQADTVANRPLTKKELHRLKVAQRNLHYNILGGPGYTPDFGVVIGATGLLTFRMNPEDKTQQRSVLPLVLSYMLKGSGVNVIVRPQLFFKNDRFRIFGEFNYKNTVENYYGIGFSTNKHTERGKDITEYTYGGYQVNPWFFFRLGESGFFVGPQVDVNYDKIKKPAAGIVADPHYQKAGGTAEGYSVFSSGLGFILSYDTRDIPSNAYHGLYLDFRGTVYSKAFGGDNNFYRIDLDYRQYLPVGKRKTLAWTVRSNNAFGNLPLTKYSLTGSPFDLRGYYKGQFRDKSSHVVMAEYRQMFNNDRQTRFKRLISHLGYAAWVGTGFMGPTPTRIEGVLPNAGLGLRIEIQPRMNLRMDIGRDLINNQNLFYLNMTEAF